MNLAKAREIIDLNINESGKKMPPDVKDALTLGSEAIKYIQYRDNCPGLNTRLLLPGETED